MAGVQRPPTPLDLSKQGSGLGALRWNRFGIVGQSSPVPRLENEPYADLSLEFELSIRDTGVVSTVFVQDIRQIGEAAACVG